MLNTKGRVVRSLRVQWCDDRRRGNVHHAEVQAYRAGGDKAYWDSEAEGTGGVFGGGRIKPLQRRDIGEAFCWTPGRRIGCAFRKVFFSYENVVKLGRHAVGPAQPKKYTKLWF